MGIYEPPTGVSDSCTSPLPEFDKATACRGGNSCGVSEDLVEMLLKTYKVGSMFAGIGGICLGFKNAGAEIVWANEYDKYACRTYRENFGNDYLVEGDIRNVDVSTIPDIDILTAGFPCQAFSIAGYQKGFQDERGNLFFEIMRVLHSKRPKAVFLENVKNLVSHDNKRTFGIISQALLSEGYHIKYKVLNTKSYGNLPQTRERIYIVGFSDIEAFNSFVFPDPVKLTTTLHDIVDINQKVDDKYYYGNSKYINMLTDAMKNRNTVYQLRRTYVRENKSGVCPTLTANMGTGGNNVPLIIDNYGIRKLTPRECLLFQGFPADFRIPKGMADSHIYKQAGNAVSVPVIERIARNIISALEASGRFGELEFQREIQQLCLF